MNDYHDRYNWLQNLKVGDKVVRTWMEHWDKEPLIVRKSTKTKLIVGNEEFRRKDGYTSGKYSRTSIHPYSEVEFVEHFRQLNEKKAQKQLANEVSNYRWRDLGIDQLQRIKAIVNEQLTTIQ